MHHHSRARRWTYPVRPMVIDDDHSSVYDHAHFAREILAEMEVFSSLPPVLESEIPEPLPSLAMLAAQSMVHFLTQCALNESEQALLAKYDLSQLPDNILLAIADGIFKKYPPHGILHRVIAGRSVEVLLPPIAYDKREKIQIVRSKGLLYLYNHIKNYTESAGILP